MPAALRYDPVTNPQGRAADGVRRGAQHLRRRSGDRLRAAAVRQRRRAVRPEGAERRRDHAAAVPRPERAHRRLRSGRQLRRRPVGRRRRRDQARLPGRPDARRRAAASPSIPVFDNAGATTTTGGYHYQWFHFAMRERMRKQNGDVGQPRDVARRRAGRERRGRVFDRWVTAVKADHSTMPAHEKVVREPGRLRPSMAAGRQDAERRRRSSPSRRRSAASRTRRATRSTRRTSIRAPGRRRAARRRTCSSAS